MSAYFDSDVDDFVDRLVKNDRFRMYLAGFTSAIAKRVLAEADGAASDAESKKLRAEGRQLVYRIQNPTKAGLKAHPEVRELINAASNAPKAPPEFKKRTKQYLAEAGE